MVSASVRRLLAAALLLMCASAVSAAEKTEDDSLFRSKDLFELEVATDPQISPDGRRIVYVRRSMDIMTDRPRDNLWIVQADGSDHRPLLSGRQGYSSPRWSPDGTRIAYVSAAEGSPQLYVRWLDSGQTALVTNLTEAPASLSWSPDGSLLAFTVFVPKEKEPLAKPPKPPEGASWGPPVKVIDTLAYRADGAGFLESGYRHVFAVSAEGGTPRQLTRGDFNHEGPLSWTPDGKRILLSANRSPDWEYDRVESEIFALNLADGELRQLTDRDGPDASPVVSPDGGRVAYVGFDDRRQGYQVTQLYVMGIDGANRRPLTADFDRDVGDPRWSGDGRGLYFLFQERGETKLGYVTLDGKVRTVTGGIGGVSTGRPYTSGAYSVSAKGVYAVTVNSPHRPADIASGTGGQAAKQLTHLNDDLLGHKRLGAVQGITWKSSHDGREVQGWVVTPPDFDPAKKYPLLLEIHGGPFAAYGPNFTSEIQLYAAAGYVVLYANPRGSTSYGEEFGNLIHHAYPGNDYDDLMSGVDAVIAAGYVDADNLFVTGGSGGGVLTAWIVGNTDRFRAAVVSKPVINWASFVLTTDVSSYATRYWFPAYPWEQPEHYWRRSPLALVGNVKTPTMLLTGELDYRTPIGESEQYYQALKLRMVDTALVRVPESAHGIGARPTQTIGQVENVLAWFGKYRTDGAGQQ